MTEFQLGQTIYAPTKTGNVKTWRCNVQIEGTYPTLVIISQTKLDGKPVVRRQIFTEGKNIGKSNETTPHEQAVSEAESRYRKQFDNGYQAEIPTDTSKANCNALGFPKPMLAYPVDKVKDPEFPAFIQPKLDGHRALVTRQDGELVMYSRQGKWITTMNHILNQLDGLLDEGVILDGELYVHGTPLQTIGSWVKKARPESAQVVYVVYDVIMDKPYHKRLDFLSSLLRCIPADECVRLIYTDSVETIGEAWEVTSKFIADGYEGGMLRTPDKGYTAGFKSRELLKLKNFDDSEHTIVDVIEGQDRITNDTCLKVAVFVCETPDGKQFECTAYGDQYEKDRIWHNCQDYIGKQLTVKHMGYTVEGKPWHPVALRLREDV